MKKVFLCWVISLSVFVQVAFAQTPVYFEGVLTYEVTGKFIDPAKGTELKQNLERLMIPENKKKIKEMEASLKDSVLSKQLDQNPLKKAQMMQNVFLLNQYEANPSMDPLQMLVPKEVKLSLLEGNYLIAPKGGYAPLMNTKLYLKAKDERWVYSENAKTYSRIPLMKIDSSFIKSKVESLDEFEKIAGYKCQKYRITYTKNGKASTHVVWATTEIAGIPFDYFSSIGISEVPMVIDFSRIKGVPVKIETASGDLTYTVQLISATKEKVVPEVFLIPKGLKEVAYRINGR